MNDRMGALKWLMIPVLFGLYFVARKTNDGPEAPSDDDAPAPTPTATISKSATPMPTPTLGKASHALTKVPAPKTSGTASAPAGKVAPKSATKIGGATVAANKGSKMQTLEGGLKVDDEKVGDGKEAKAGDHVTVNYRGMLEDGTVFDESYKRGQPFDFTLGQGAVIKGWDVGVAGMKEGGKRKLMIPSAMGYGARGAGGTIPPNANLIFDVELLKVG